MCGIFAYVGSSTTAPQMVLEGLKLLEYRGYDSWGIAVKQDERLVVDKHTGKIGDAITTLPKSNLGIGHTRWATHGGVTVANAHPHLDCKHQLALVHNGIIENFQELKDLSLKKGHKFVSQTDTEVAVHLIEEEMKTKEFSLAVRDAFSLLKGFNAFVVANAKSCEIVAIKNGSPLVIGIGKDGLYVSSDVTGIVGHTRNIIFLEDNQMVVLGKTVRLFQLPKAKEIKPKINKIGWKFDVVSKGKHQNFMLKEIHEQAKVIANLAEDNSKQISEIAAEIKKAHGTFFIGAGTAYFATVAGVYLFSEIAKRHVNTAPASEFNYLEDFLTEKSLIIPLSQSGETVDVIEPLMHAKEKKSKIISLVNTLGSTIYRMSNYSLLLGAGPEKAVASTKVYTAKIAALLLLSYEMIGKRRKAVEILLKSSKEIARLLENDQVKKIQNLAKKIASSKDIYVIGRGVSSSSAMEAALKIKEVSYIHAEGVAGGELKHGSIALIEKGTPCIVFAPNDKTYDSIISNATEVKSRGGYIIGVSSVKSSVFDEWIEVKDCEYGSVIAQIVPLQLLACYLAMEKHLDPDKPRNLAKSVVVK